MTNDPVDAVVQAYLDHLEEGAPEPSLDHLTPNERKLAQDLIDSLKAGRGIDPYQSRPSLSSLLSGTEFESLISPQAHTGLTIDAIRGDIVSALGASAEPIADGAALNEGIRSDAVIVYGGLRLRVQFRDDVSTPTELSNVDPRAAAGTIYGRFRDTAGVILVMADPELSSVPIGPFDTDDYIGAPDGQLHAPRITRPVLPLFDTLRAYVDEVAPDLATDADLVTPSGIEVPSIIRDAATAARDAVVAEGKRSRTEGKKDAWTKFGAADEVEVVAEITADVMSGDLSPEALGARIDSVLSAA
jgi:hypothetical protein